MSRKLAALILFAAALPAAHAAPGQGQAPGPGLMPHFGQSFDQAGSFATELVKTAMSALGTPYRRGGTSVKTGFDCSGLVRASVQQTAGLILPHSAAGQAAATAKIDKAQLQPGDLVFFNTRKRHNSHVGIYLGEGNFIHAPRTGGRVRIESMNLSYWRSRFNGARRLPVNPSAPTVQAGWAKGAKKPVAVTQAKVRNKKS